MAKSEEKEEKKETTPDEKGKEDPQFVQVPKDEYEGLKSKVGELSSYIDETREYMQGASTVINTLAYDPELRAKFREKVGKSGVVEDGEESGKQEEEEGKETPPYVPNAGQTKADKTIEDVASSQREQIITEFEKEAGIFNLEGDAKKEARQKVEAFLNDFGMSVQTAPLVSLKKNLDRAYVATHAEKLREEGRLEGMTTQRANQNGVMGTFSGGAPSGDQSSDLSAGQKKWVEKFGLDPDKVKGTYQNREKEAVREKKSE